jgi:hypothetical protein
MPMSAEECRAQPPGQHPPGRPVDDRDQVQKPLSHRDVGYVSGPHLVRLVDRRVGILNQSRNCAVESAWSSCLPLGWTTGARVC